MRLRRRHARITLHLPTVDQGTRVHAIFYNERMCASLTRNRIALLLDVARLYWEEGLGQKEIARRTLRDRKSVV